MTARDRLDQLDRIAAAATPGPWSRHDFGVPGDQEPSSIVVHTGRFDWQAIYDGEDSPAVAWLAGWDSQGDADAQLIAEARTAVPQLVAALRAVLDLHLPIYNGGERQFCRADSEWFPCSTVTAVESALGCA